MKKFILIFSVVSILFLTGCDLNKNIENTDLLDDIENHQQEAVDNNEILNMSFYDRTNEFNKIREDCGKLIMTSDSYGNYIQLIEHSIGDIVLEKQNGNYVLNISILSAVSFEKAEIDAVVKNMEDNNLEIAKLGDFMISKTISDEQKKSLDFMKENHISGIELNFWKEYSNTNWINEDGIPVYIRSNIYDNESADYLWALKKVDDASSDGYYMFRIQPAGQDGLYSVLNSSSAYQVKINLVPTDIINIKEYNYEIELKNEENMTIEEYFNNNSKGKSSITIDTSYIKIKDDAIYLEFYNSDI